MKIFAVIIAFLLLAVAAIYFLREPAPTVFHADFVGSQVCGDCHWINYDAWKISPHHNIARIPAEDSVVGDFDEGKYHFPQQNIESDNELPAAQMYQRNGQYFMTLRDAGKDTYSKLTKSLATNTVKLI